MPDRARLEEGASFDTPGDIRRQDARTVVQKKKVGSWQRASDLEECAFTASNVNYPWMDDCD
jgi:hypothetical protein